jgi:hypothetical protein
MKIKNRTRIFHEISKKRDMQEKKYGGVSHDVYHNENDWIAFIAKQLGKAVTYHTDGPKFRDQMLHVAALAVAAVEAFDESSEVILASSNIRKRMQP